MAAWLQDPITVLDAANLPILSNVMEMRRMLKTESDLMVSTDQPGRKTCPAHPNPAHKAIPRVMLEDGTILPMDPFSRLDRDLVLDLKNNFSLIPSWRRERRRMRARWRMRRKMWRIFGSSHG